MTDKPKTDDPSSPLGSPSELAGSTEGAIAAEFAARDAEDAIEADEEDTLPLDGE